MKYLFTNKDVKIGDICIAVCCLDHCDSLGITQYFKQHFASTNKHELVRLGLKIVWVSKTRCRGYIVFENKDKKIQSFKIDNSKVYITLTTGQTVGLIKY